MRGSSRGKGLRGNLGSAKYEMASVEGPPVDREKRLLKRWNLAESELEKRTEKGYDPPGRWITRGKEVGDSRSQPNFWAFVS